MERISPAGATSFGASVDVDGDHVVVGAPSEDQGRGAVYLYFDDPVAGWTQQARLASADRSTGDAFGHSVDLDANFLLIGAPGGGDEGGVDAGAAYIFIKEGHWREQARLTAPDPALYDSFGYAVALNGLYGFVGAPFDDDDGTDAGAVYVHEYTGQDIWTHAQRVAPSGIRDGDAFGMAISLDSEWALVGAPTADEPRGRDAGLAYVYARTAGSSWILRAVLRASDALGGNHFGASLALSTHPATGVASAVIGAPMSGSTGATYLFRDKDELWSGINRYVPASPATHSGQAVALMDSGVLIGAPGGANADSGAAFLLALTEQESWEEQARLRAPEAQIGACFACSVALGEEHMVIGAPGEAATYIFARSTLPVSRSAADSNAAPTNYPNPFRHATTIVMDPESRPSPHAHLAVYDLMGRMVALLFDGPLRGPRAITWAPSALPDGVYAAVLTVDGQSAVRVMTRVR